MKKLLLTLAFLFIPSVAWAQCTGVFPANTVCGNVTGTPAVPSAQPTASFVSGVTGPASTFVGDLATWGNTGGTNLADSFPGVFNPRLKFGAIPDNSTDNSAAFTSIFALSNNYTNGVPTVYFDCGPNTTTCVYKYSGATSSGSVSSINPTVATTVLCAPGVTLNYVGTGHAADIGSGTQNLASAHPYTVMNCQWTGGISQTQGIVLANGNENPTITGNTFFNFGPTVPTSVSGASIYLAGSNFNVTVTENRWIDLDGVPRNMVDAHLSNNSALFFGHNIVDCQNGAIGSPCQTSPAGYGLWVQGARITNNIIFAHYPNVRYSSHQCCSPLVIVSNHFEGNASPSPLITYGDPGVPAGGTLSGVDISHNSFFQLSASTSVPIIGPETASVGSYGLGFSVFSYNNFLATPGAGAFYLQSGIASNRITGNFGPSLLMIPPNQFCDQTCANGAFYGAPIQGLQTISLSDFAGNVLAMDSTGTVITDGSLNSIAQPLICINNANSNSQSCNTRPNFQAPTGSVIVPVTGSTIFYISNFANTGDVTLTVNGTAGHIRKNNATQALLAGDIAASVYYVLTFDGTFWEMQNPPRTSTFGPLTFLQLPPASGFQGTTTYVSDGRAGGCADGTCTTWGTAVTSGGGALPLLVWSNGTSWTLVGK